MWLLVTRTLQRTRAGRSLPCLTEGGPIEHLGCSANKHPTPLQPAKDHETRRSLFHVQLLSAPLILPSQAPLHKPFRCTVITTGPSFSTYCCSGGSTPGAVFPSCPHLGTSKSHPSSQKKSPLPRSNTGFQWKGAWPLDLPKPMVAPAPARLSQSGENFLLGSLKTSKTQNN